MNQLWRGFQRTSTTRCPLIFFLCWLGDVRLGSLIVIVIESTKKTHRTCHRGEEPFLLGTITKHLLSHGEQLGWSLAPQVTTQICAVLGILTLHAMVSWRVVHGQIAHAAKMLSSTREVHHGVWGVTKDTVRAAMGIITNKSKLAS